MEYNFTTEDTKTILSTPFSPVYSYSYNPIENLIAYSICSLPTSLHIFDIQTGTDTVIYHQDSLECNSTFQCFSNLTWDDSFTQLSFFSFGAVNPIAGINYYNSGSSDFINLIDCYDNGYQGYKYNMDWLGKNNLIFIWYDSDRSLTCLASINISSTVGLNSEITKKDFFISQNFPNPYNPATEITYQLPEAGHVKITVYDILGKEVAELVNATKSAGKYSVTFDASKFSSGTYIYRMKSGQFVESKKMVILK